MKVVLGVTVCLIICLQSGYAQEADKGKSNKKKLRETQFKIRNKQGDKARKGDITGRKIKRRKTKKRIIKLSPTPYSSVHYKKNKGRKKEGTQIKKSVPSFNKPSKSTENYRKGDIAKRKIRKSVTPTGEGKTVQIASDPYAKGNKRASEQKGKISSRSKGFRTIAQSSENTRKKRKKIKPKTASAAFIVRRKINPYAGRPQRRYKARTKDIAGRTLRRKNFKSRPQPIVKTSFNPYVNKTNRGEQIGTPMKGAGYISTTRKKQAGKPIKGSGYISATKKGERAWKKDIAGRKLRLLKNPGATTGKKGVPYTGIENRVLSISGTLKNNNGQPLNQRPPSLSTHDALQFVGKIKVRYAKKPNAHKNALKGVAPNKNVTRMSTYIPKYAKVRYAKKPNAHKNALKGVAPNKNVTRMSTYIPKYAKVRYAKKPNAHKNALKGVAPNKNVTRMSTYIPKYAKVRYAKKPNAHKNALKGVAPNKNVTRIDTYIPKYAKVRYAKKPNAHKNALKGVAPNKNVTRIDTYIPKYAKVRYAKKPNAHKNALKGVAPNKNVTRIDTYIPKYAKVRYAKKPNAHKNALKGVAPNKNVTRIDTYIPKHVKVFYVRNPNAHKNALKGIGYKSATSTSRAFKVNIWWARLFEKNKGRSAAKEKIRTPRYDKHEKDLWYD